LRVVSTSANSERDARAAFVHECSGRIFWYFVCDTRHSVLELW